MAIALQVQGRDFMDNRFLNDQDIQALVDNQLGWEDEKKVRKMVADDPRAQERFNALREQKNLLVSWWHHRKSH